METAQPKRCFVIIPFGKKQDLGNQQVIDFDEVYEYIIKEVAEKLGLEVIKCDEIQGAGWIHRDMLEHIYRDDVAIVDITTRNPNVFYELGVRHALRRSVTVLMKQKDTDIPFDIRGMRILDYDTTLRGSAAARQQLEEFIRNGLTKQHNDSLVYDIFPDLQVSRQ